MCYCMPVQVLACLRLPVHEFIILKHVHVLLYDNIYAHAFISEHTFKYLKILAHMQLHTFKGMYICTCLHKCIHKIYSCIFVCVCISMLAGIHISTTFVYMYAFLCTTIHLFPI